MRVLEIHCTLFSYQIKKSTPVAEDPELENEELKDVLVCFVCFEKKDNERVEELVVEFVQNIKVDISRIKCNKILLYPYAHLSKELGSPRLAKKFISDVKNKLIEENIDAHKSPFGWYKAFKLECIGHPLSEAYREF